ncbi:MAG: transposase [Chloroflexota bacterium]
MQAEACTPNNIMEFSSSPHRPLHIYADDTWYFISASTLNHVRYFHPDERLTLWQDVFLKAVQELGVLLCAWVLLPDHYHILVKFLQSRDVSRFMQLLHGRTSRLLNQLDDTQGRKIWYSYWDICIRNETDFWTRFNYIHYNPVKHGYVDDPEKWEFSSYRFHLQKEGAEWLSTCWLGYPADTLLPDDKF